jgi:hypothetical protein
MLPWYAPVPPTQSSFCEGRAKSKNRKGIHMCWDVVNQSMPYMKHASWHVELTIIVRKFMTFCMC